MDEVCFEPWYNPSWLTGFKTPTNWPCGLCSEDLFHCLKWLQTTLAIMLLAPTRCLGSCRLCSEDLFHCLTCLQITLSWHWHRPDILVLSFMVLALTRRPSPCSLCSDGLLHCLKWLQTTLAIMLLAPTRCLGSCGLCSEDLFHCLHVCRSHYHGTGINQMSYSFLSWYWHWPDVLVLAASRVMASSIA